MEYQPLKGKLCDSFGFKLDSNGEITDSKKVYCFTCKKAFSYSGSNSSLQYHLKNKHPFKIEPVPSSSTLDSFICKPISSVKEVDLTNAIAKWIVSDSRPISIVLDTGLKEVLRIALNSSAYNLPSRSTISNRIIKLFEIQKLNVVEKIKNASFVSLTGDFWTSLANESYLGVTAHWINDEWVYCDATLQVKHVSGKHTADACANEFEEVAQEWGIQDKIVSICTDNARNVVLGIEKSKYDNLRCAAHTIQLSLNKAIKEASLENLLIKCRKIVGHFKHSANLEYLLLSKMKELGLPETKLQQDVVTRWNSIYIMFESLLKCKQAVIDIMATHPSKVNALLLTEWQKLEKMTECFKPCLQLTDLLGGSKYVTASVVIPAVAHLKMIMQPSENDPAYVCKFKQTLIEDLSNRISSWNNYDKYEEATALDPRFKSLKCMIAGKRELIWDRILQSDIDDVQTEQEHLLQSKRRKLVFEEDTTQPDTGTLAPKSSSLKAELQVYRSLIELDDDFVDPLKWWKTHSVQLPRLAIITKKRLCMSATSVPCERVFSAAGFIVNKQRTALSSENINRLLCLKSWNKQ